MKISAFRTNRFTVNDIAAFKAWVSKYDFGDGDGDTLVREHGSNVLSIAVDGESYSTAQPVFPNNDDLRPTEFDIFVAELRTHLRAGGVFVAASSYISEDYTSAEWLVVTHDTVVQDQINSGGYPEDLEQHGIDFDDDVGFRLYPENVEHTKIVIAALRSYANQLTGEQAAWAHETAEYYERGLAHSA